MVEIEFDFEQRKIVIQAELDEPFKNAINKFKQKSLLISDSFFFAYNGNQIRDPLMLIKNIINDVDQRNKKMKIFIHNNYQDNKDIINEEKNSINIIYKTKNQNEIRIFGFNFVRNNKDICHILIDNKKFDLFHTLQLNNKQKQQETLQIKLINIKN